MTTPSADSSVSTATSTVTASSQLFFVSPACCSRHAINVGSAGGNAANTNAAPAMTASTAEREQVDVEDPSRRSQMGIKATTNGARDAQKHGPRSTVDGASRSREKAPASSASSQPGQNGRSNPPLPLTVQPNMNSTSNVLMHFQLSDLASRSKTNLYLALVCLGVCAINIVLIFLNFAEYHIPEWHGHPLMVSHHTFHIIEFWSVFVYALADVGALLTTPKTMLNIYSKPLVLKLLLFCNIVASFVPAVLITLDTDYFERFAHELEYINEFTLSFIMLILLTSLLRQTRDENDAMIAAAAVAAAAPVTSSSSSSSSSSSPAPSSTVSNDKSSSIMALLACGVALTTFVVYNFSREEYAHYWEFTFNIITSMVTFWFCMDNRFVAEMEIGQILYGQHKNCNLCQTHFTDYQVTRQTSVRWMSLYGAADPVATAPDPSTSPPGYSTTTTTTTLLTPMRDGCDTPSPYRSIVGVKDERSPLLPTYAEEAEEEEEASSI